MGKCYALSLKDGAEKWIYSNTEEDPAKSSPCVAGSLIVYGDDVGMVRGLDRATGKELWKFEAQGRNYMLADPCRWQDPHRSIRQFFVLP